MTKRTQRLAEGRARTRTRTRGLESYGDATWGSLGKLTRHRVGARLAASAPPGTVRAPLDAYGSTSETTERHSFQRGQRLVTSLPVLQVGLCPLEDEAKITPIVVATILSSDNMMDDDFSRVFQR